MASNPEIEKLKRDAGARPYESRGLKVGSQRCIFHDDRTPSLTVKDGGDGFFFKCLGCGKGGDVIKFIELHDKVSFPKALETLRKELGQPTQEYAPFVFNQEQAASRLKEVLPYLESRGITEDIAKEAGLGAVDFPGLGLAVSIPYGVEQDGKPVVKFRAVKPGPGKKFRHIVGTSTDELLYGIAILDDPTFEWTPDLWVTESELDALMLRRFGYNAVSVSSATSSLDADGKLKYDAALFKKISEAAEHIFIATDMDDAGEKNALAWLKCPTETQGAPCQRQAPDKFEEQLPVLGKEALKPPWRRKFHRLDELPDGDTKMLIDGILPEGVTFLGSLSGVGKTWVALSMARALTRGEKFMNVWNVPEPMNVLYLIPESGAKAFKRRALKMQINPERFFCQTMNDGVPISLQDPMLIMAIRDLKPVVVFLDTAIRFQTIQDENSATQNAQGLARGIFGLINRGAAAVTGMHHAPKASGEKERMSLENCLRGSGDIGAMCDCVWGLQHDRGGDGEGSDYLLQSQNLTRIFLRCVKL